MVYSGRSFSKTAARLKEMWSTEDEEIGISLQTVRHWVLRYSVAAMASLQETKVPSSGRWSLWGIKGSYFESAWFMMDKDTGYILSYQIPPIRNDGSPRAVVRKALASSASPPVSVAYYGVWTTGGRLSGVGNEGPALVLLREELTETAGIQLQEAIDTGGDGTSPLVKEPVTASCRILQRFDRVRNQGSLHIYTHGWVITRNLFTCQEGLGGQTPAQAAGVTAQFASWADVVRMEAQAHIPAPCQHRLSLDPP